jgi:hypothetical protein
LKDDTDNAAEEVLRRFLQGETTAADLEAAARRLDVSSIAELCERLATAPCGPLEVNLSDLARQLRRFLAGESSREEISLWVGCLHSVLSSGWAATGSRSLDDEAPDAGSNREASFALRFLSILFDPDHKAPPARIRTWVQRALRCLETSRPVPLRAFLPRLFRDLDRVRLRAVESPVDLVEALENQWIDVGLVGSRGCRVRLIPFSVFTRRFFVGDLPAMLTSLASLTSPGETERCRGDDFYYHPENNKAISLKERCSKLRTVPFEFQYFVDETGLAEIVLDVPAIHRAHLSFAAKLFCLQNGIRRATLDGRRVSSAWAAR